VARELASPVRRRSLRLFAVLCCAIGVGAIVACSSDGVTTDCSPDGGNCLTPAVDAASFPLDAGAG
jgi:hypothetical protein